MRVSSLFSFYQAQLPKVRLQFSPLPRQKYFSIIICECATPPGISINILAYYVLLLCTFSLLFLTKIGDWNFHMYQRKMNLLSNGQHSHMITWCFLSWIRYWDFGNYKHFKWYNSMLVWCYTPAILCYFCIVANGL